MAMSESLRKRIQDLVEREPVVVFMKGTRRAPACGFSAQVVQMLDDLVPSYETVDVLSDPALRDGIKEFSEWPTIPQVYVKGKFVGGCDIVRELFTSGELAQVIGAEPTEVTVPKITVTKAAADAFGAALAEAGDEVLHFQVAAGFQYDLYFGPREAGDIEVKAGALTMFVDRATARRSDGVHIDFVEGEGGGFKIDNPNEPARVRQIVAPELQAMLSRGEIELYDVRPKDERARASIAGAKPLDAGGQEHLASLPRDRAIAFHCHHGIRSQAAAERAIAEGFTKVYNLRGGIDAWSTGVDAKVPRY